MLSQTRPVCVNCARLAGDSGLGLGSALEMGTLQRRGLGPEVFLLYDTQIIHNALEHSEEARALFVVDRSAYSGRGGFSFGLGASAAPKSIRISIQVTVALGALKNSGDLSWILYLHESGDLEPLALASPPGPPRTYAEASQRGSPWDGQCQRSRKPSS